MIQLSMIQQKDPKSSVRADKESHLHWTVSAKIIFFPKEYGTNHEKKTSHHSLQHATKSTHTWCTVSQVTKPIPWKYVLEARDLNYLSLLESTTGPK